MKDAPMSMSPPASAKPDLISRLQKLPVRHRWLRWAVLAFSLAFAAGSGYFFYLGIQEEGRLRFGRTALSVGRDLDARIRAYEDVLYAMRGLFDAADQVRHEDFHEFAEALAIPKRYPGVTNIHFARRLSGGQKQAFERTVRAEKSPLTKGLPEFSIKPPGERPEYLVLHYIEPLARSAIVWGMDLNADPRRRSALDRARDGGQLAATSGITLESDAKSSVTSLLFRLAVYRGKGVPNTVEDRRRLYWGMVGSTTRVGEMVEAALPKQTLARVRVIIREASEASAGVADKASGALLYDSEARGSAPAATDYSEYAITRDLSVADRTWRLDIVPLVNPVNPLNQAAVAMVLAVSLAASAFLFWLMSSVATSESRGAELAKTNEALRVENFERKRAEEKAARFYAMVDNSTEYVSMASPDGKVFYLNPAGRRMAGIAQDADVGAINWRDMFDDENWKLRLETALPTLRATGHWEGEIRMRNLETGKMLDLLVHAFKVEDPRTKAPLCIATIQRDITERRRADDALSETADRLREASNTLDARNFELAAHNREITALRGLTNSLQLCVSVAEAAEVIKRFCVQSFPGSSGAVYVFQSSRNYLDSVTGWGAQQHVRNFQPNDCWALRRGQAYRVKDEADIHCPHAGTGEGAPSRCCCIPMSAHGNTIGLIHIAFGTEEKDADDHQFLLAQAFTDEVTLALANLRLRDTLRDQAIRDPLTGLYNRRYLEETLERELARARRSSHSIAVFMLDVDHFKRFNDQFGHEVGDLVLRSLSKTMKDSCRASDVPCRFGGEEFTVVLTDIPKQAAVQWGERFLDKVRKLEVKAGERGVGRITISIGLALFPDDGTDIETLLQAADVALYQAKHSGRDRQVVFQDSAGRPGPGDAKAIPADLKAAT